MPETKSVELTQRQKPVFYGYIIVVVGFLIMGVFGGVVQSFGVFLKPVSADFGWTRAMTSGAFSMFMVILGISSLGTGILTDRFGPRIVVTICGLFFGLGNLLMSQVSALWQMYVLYGVLIAIGTSGSFVPLASTIARWFIKKRALMTGIVISGSGAGAVVAAPIIGWLISVYSWRMTYLIVGIASLALLVLFAQFLKRDPAEKGCLPFGESEANPEGVVYPGGGFSLIEAVRTRQFWLLSLGYLSCNAAPPAITVHLVPHATDIGIPALAAATAVTFFGGLNSAGRLAMGNIADRMGYKRALTGSLFIMLAALIWLQFVGELWMLYTFAAVFGFGWGGPGTVLSPLVAQLFGMRAHGLIMAAVNLAGLAGGALASFLVGYIFDVTRSYYPAFIVIAVLMAMSIVSVALVKPQALLKDKESIT